MSRNGTPDAGASPGRWMNADIEMGALGAAIEDPDARRVLVDALSPDDFGRDTHAIVFRVLAEMHRAGKAVDAVLLADEMERRGITFRELHNGGLGGLDVVLTSLVENATLSCNVPSYAAVLKDDGHRRKLAEVVDSLGFAARARAAPVAEIISAARGELDRIGAERANREHRIEAIGAGVLARRTLKRQWMVQGIIVENQPCIVGGPKKALKTSVCVDLAVSLASATRFLGEFPVERPTTTLFVSGESGDASIQEAALRVAEAKGIDLEELDDLLFFGFELPRLSDAQHLETLGRFIREKAIRVVILDPLYLMLLSGNTRLDAANLFDVGPLLATITRTCLEAGATPLLVHHLRKNRERPNDLPELEDLAFAGIAEFARQWLLIGRRETYEPGSGLHRLWLSVGGSAGHSGAWALDVDEGTIGDDFGGRGWRVSVQYASEARRTVQEAAQEAHAAKEAEKTRAARERHARQLGEAAAEALTVLRRLGKATVRHWRDHLRVSSEKFGPVLAYLLEQRQVRECLVTVRNGTKGTKNVDGYEPA